MKSIAELKTEVAEAHKKTPMKSIGSDTEVLPPLSEGRARARVREGHAEGKLDRSSAHWRKSWIDRTIDGKVIGERDGWVLFVREDRSNPQWLNMKLFHKTAKRKAGRSRSFHLGFNGTRLAKNTDTGKLYEFHPTLAEWVIECAREHHHGL